MAIYWTTEAIPLAVTAFLPIVLFPLLGVQATASVSKNYMKETNMMFVGGLIIALAVEYCGLHKRVALRVMTVVGTSPIRLMLGIMLTTSFLSMWISNTATTAMMVPIVLAVLQEFKRDEGVEEDDSVPPMVKGGGDNNSPLDFTSSTTTIPAHDSLSLSNSETDKSS
jgi:sodium-dependent dicarboxylate transporter 2/3/5